MRVYLTDTWQLNLHPEESFYKFWRFVEYNMFGWKICLVELELEKAATLWVIVINCEKGLATLLYIYVTEMHVHMKKYYTGTWPTQEILFSAFIYVILLNTQESIIF